jgi:hypothetical protein
MALLGLLLCTQHVVLLCCCVGGAVDQPVPRRVYAAAVSIEQAVQVRSYLHHHAENR